MKIPFPKQTALGLGAALIIIGSFVGVWAALPVPVPDPAMVVPAKETVAFFTQITQSNAEAMIQSFPVLAGVPLTDAPSAVAIVKTASGTAGWVILTPTATGDQPFTIKTSHPAFAELFTPINQPLGRNTEYKMLRAEEGEGLSAYLRFPDISLNAESTLAPLLHTATPVFITTATDGTSIHFLKDNALNFSALTGSPKDIFADPLLILQVSNGADLLHLASTHLKSAPALVTKTVLNESLRSLFGKDLSPAYELPVLLHGQTALHVARNGTGSGLRFVLEGAAPRNRKIFDRLAELYTAELATIAHDNYLFDAKFTFRDVRKDETLIEKTTSTENGWNIRGIRQTQFGTSFWIGLRGNRYILSNDAAAFQKSITQEEGSVSTLDPVPVGLGLMESTQLNTLLADSLGPVWPTITLPSGTGGYLKWKMTQDGQTITIMLKKV